MAVLEDLKKKVKGRSSRKPDGFLLPDDEMSLVNSGKDFPNPSPETEEEAAYVPISELQPKAECSTQKVVLETPLLDIELDVIGFTENNFTYFLFLDKRPAEFKPNFFELLVNIVFPDKIFSGVKLISQAYKITGVVQNKDLYMLAFCKEE